MAQLDMNASLAERVERAKQKKGKPAAQSDASRTRDIRPNRAKEKALRRVDEVFRPGQSIPGSPRPGAKVMPFPGGDGSSAEPDYTPPSLGEILGDEDDD